MQLYHSVSVVGTLLLQIGEVGQRVKLQRSASVLGAGGDTEELVSCVFSSCLLVRIELKVSR